MSSNFLKNTGGEWKLIKKKTLQEEKRRSKSLCKIEIHK
jgi:hypothetical protein